MEADEPLIEEFTSARRVADGRECAARLRAPADHAEAQAARDERILAELKSALGMTAQLRLEDLDPWLAFW